MFSQKKTKIFVGHLEIELCSNEKSKEEINELKNNFLN